MPKLAHGGACGTQGMASPGHGSSGGPLRGSSGSSSRELRDGEGSPKRTRDLPRRSKSGPLRASGGSRVAAAQRSLFLSPPPPIQSPPDGVRDIAGRWHGTPPPQWGAL